MTTPAIAMSSCVEKVLSDSISLATMMPTTALATMITRCQKRGVGAVYRFHSLVNMTKVND